MRPRPTTSVLLLLLLGLPALPLAGQQAPLTGTVRARRGAPVGGAEVRALPSGAAAATDQEGRFTLAAGSADSALRVTAIGYVPETVPLGTRRDVAVLLTPLVILDAITVTASEDRPLLNTEDAATGGAIEAAELAALPTDQRDPLALAFNIPGVAQAQAFFGDAPPLSINGANAIYTAYTLDGLDNTEGFLGGPRVEFPLGGLQRLEVLANTYGVAAGRSSNGVVNQESRAGGNRWAGELFGYWRPGRPLDAQVKLPDGTTAEAAEQLRRQQDGFRRFQLGGGAGGPLVRDRTFVFGAAEYTNEIEDRIASTALTSFVGSEEREKVKLFGRLDHGWSPTQTTTLRFAYSRVNRAGRGSGVVTPKADVTTRRIGSLTALTHRSAFAGGRGSHAASVQFGTYRWYFPPSASDFSRPQVTVLSADGETVEAVVGSSNFIFDETERQLQLRDVVELRTGRHTLRAGADALFSWFELAGAQTNPNGAYEVYNDGNITPAAGSVLRFEDIPDDVRVRSYTIDANPQQVNLTQGVYGLFVEDRWRATPTLTLTGGLRWDYDDITSRGESAPDLDNLQPRLAFNWVASGHTVVRGGTGWYAGKFPYAVYSDAVQFGPDGNATVSFREGSAFPPPAFGEGPRAEDLDALRDQLPPREVRRMFALGLEQPMSWQASLGLQRQLGRDWAVTVDAVWVETRNLPRSIDLNAITRPLGPGDSLDVGTDAGDPFRPETPVAGGFRRLTTTASGGRARYVGLYTAVRRRLSARWTADLNWTWSRSRNDTEDINFNAAQANCFGRDGRDALTGAPCTTSEWADAVNDRRHKVTLRTVYTTPQRIQLAAIADWQTGLPVNRIAFRRDLDGSGPIFGNGFIGNEDRFAGVPRNGERLPNFFEVSLSAAWAVPVGGGALEVRSDVFNALNATEWGGFATGLPGGGSRTQVGRPGDPILLRAPGRPRQVQLSARYLF